MGLSRTVLAPLLGVVMIAASAPACEVCAGNSGPVVAAASDLQFALTEVADAFAAETGERVRLSFGSSGNFARQIRQNAPYEVFFSADEAFVDDLAADGYMRDHGQLYAIGRLVLIVPAASPLQADGTLEDLKAAVVDGRLKKFAIANPEHAPYGKRAEEALRSRGLWDLISPRLVLGENVSQAAQFATTGDTQGGIIAYALALAPKVAALGSYDLIPEAWHQPLRQRVALTRRAGPIAEQFYQFVQSPAARVIFNRFGFVLPEGNTDEPAAHH